MLRLQQLRKPSAGWLQEHKKNSINTKHGCTGSLPAQPCFYLCSSILRIDKDRFELLVILYIKAQA